LAAGARRPLNADSLGGAIGGIWMSNFLNLNDAIESIATDPSTAARPIKRMCIADGEFASANYRYSSSQATPYIRRLPTTRSSSSSKAMLISEWAMRGGGLVPGIHFHSPQHSPRTDQRFAALSVFAPFFGRSKRNIDWDRDQT
jgi:hypothetical protein